MKSTRYNLLSIGICGYVQIILYNGIIKHFGLQLSFLETIRPFLPEFFLVIYLVGWAISRKRYRKRSIFLGLWLAIVGVISLFNVPSSTAILSAVRDLLEPCLFLVTLSTINLSAREKEKLTIMFERIFIFFVLVGVYFAVTQKMQGSQWTSTYFAGHSIWGVDAESGIRVTAGSFGFKVLGTTASAETFGFYNMLALIVILFSNRNLLLKTIVSVLTFLNMFYAGIKTALIVGILVLYIYLMNKHGKNMNFLVKVGSVLIILGLFYYTTFVLSDWEDSSFYARLVFWKSLLSTENVINLVLPMKMFFYSAKAGNTGIISFWDNSYFYFMYSTGIVGLILLISNLVEKARVLRQLNSNVINCGNMILLSVALSGVSTCLFLGRNYIAIAMLIICIQASFKGECEERLIRTGGRL